MQTLFARRIGRCLALVVITLLAGCATLTMPRDDVPLGAPDGYFPHGEWRTSTPGAQGFDSEALGALFDAIETQHLPIHSLHVVRYGHLVLDAYFHPFARGRRHDIASVTKSITTTLIGLALVRGALPSLDTPVYPLLTAKPPADPRQSQISIRHLLTTSSGLDCGYAPYEREMLAMATSRDWVRYALALPMRDEPGRRFVYCSPGFHLLSALITRSTGLAAEDFARQTLFAPLDITDLCWPRDPQGVNQGAGDLQLLPTDLLKLGYLFLRHGMWQGQQVVPHDWIAQATRRQVETPTSRGGGYGFGWWMVPDMPGLYQASGRGGQRLIVWPAKDIVIVFTGGGFDPGPLAPLLLRALKSNAALPAQPEAYQRLLARVARAALPRPEVMTLQPLPARAATVSGIEYALEANPLGVRRLRLQFFNEMLAEVRVERQDGGLLVPVGLDGAYRLGVDPASHELVAGRGRWTGPDEFVLEIDMIARINHFTVVQRFDGDRLLGHVRERGGLIDTSLNGHVAR